jgi:RND superfamily putative drug exporter
MSGMLLTGDADFASFGVATMMVVAVAMIGSLTVLPALLSKLGDKVERGRVPFVHRVRRDGGEPRVWGAIIDRVLRRPVLSAVLSGALLVALAIPAFQLHTAQPSIESYPQKFLTAYNRIKVAFPGTDVAANVVLKAPNVDAPAVKQAIGQLESRAGDRLVNEPIDFDVNPAKTVASISIPVDGNGTDATSNKALAALETTSYRRRARLPVRRSPSPEPLRQKDYEDDEDGAARVRCAAVRVHIDADLFPLGRIAAKAVLLNLLSMPPTAFSCSSSGTAGKNLLGFEFTGRIDHPPDPALRDSLRIVDEHVFILSRVRGPRPRRKHRRRSRLRCQVNGWSRHERRDRDDRRFLDLRHAAGAVFKQFGVEHVAVLIDATIIRAILLPASMKLLGEWNWYRRSGSVAAALGHGGDEPEPVTAPPAVAPTIWRLDSSAVSASLRR